MDNFFSVPVFNSEEGKSFYNAISKHFGKPEDMQTVAVLNVIRLPVYMPEPICSAIISPLAALPLLINHPDRPVKDIVQLRLMKNI
jgi:hypothetical protein